MGPATAGDPPATVTLAFYDKRIRPAEPGHIARHDWELLQLLVSRGADVSAPEAAPLRAALARKAVPVDGLFIALQ